MVDDQVVQLQIQLELENGDQQEVDRQARQLLQEMRTNPDVESAELLSSGMAPDGTKAVDPVLLGALVIAIAPAVTDKVLDFLHAWMMRREGRMVKIKIQTAKDASIELEIPERMSQTDFKKLVKIVNETLTKGKDISR